MVAEQNILDMQKAIDGLLKANELNEKKIGELRMDKDLHDKKIAEMETRATNYDDWTINFGDAINLKIAKIESDANTAQGQLNIIVEGAKLEFDTTNTNLRNLWEQANIKFNEHNNGFEEMNAKIQLVLTEAHAGGGGGHGKKAGFLPDKMMIPKPFNHDISV